MTGDEGLERGAKGSVATEEEMDAGVVFEGGGEGGKEFEPLLGSHVAGVEQDSLAFEAEFAAEQVGCSGVLEDGRNRCRPSWERA